MSTSLDSPIMFCTDESRTGAYAPTDDEMGIRICALAFLDSAGHGTSIQATRAELAQAEPYLQTAGIYFEQVFVAAISSSAGYQRNPSNQAELRQLFADARYEANVRFPQMCHLVLALVNTMSVDGKPFGGNSTFPWDAYQVAVVTASAVKIDKGLASAHEFGHTLGLRHTFDNETNQDGCFDTPHDPYCPGCDCDSQQGCDIECGGYTPPAHNLMSYYHCQNIYDDTLTPCQVRRARCFAAQMFGLEGAQQQIFVTSPKANDTWSEGVAYSTTWASQGVTWPLRIVARQGGVELTPTISTTAAANGIQDITVPLGWPPSSDYEICVTAEKGQVSGCSEKFTVTGPPTSKTIAVLEPRAGASWEQGTTYSATWVSSGVSLPLRIVVTRSGNEVSPTISTTARQNGSQSVTVPSTWGVGPAYRVCVTGESGSISGCSGEFSIVANSGVATSGGSVGGATSTRMMTGGSLATGGFGQGATPSYNTGGASVAGGYAGVDGGNATAAGGSVSIASGGTPSAQFSGGSAPIATGGQQTTETGGALATGGADGLANAGGAPVGGAPDTGTSTIDVTFTWSPPINYPQNDPLAGPYIQSGPVYLQGWYPGLDYTDYLCSMASFGDSYQCTISLPHGVELNFNVRHIDPNGSVCADGHCCWVFDQANWYCAGCWGQDMSCGMNLGNVRVATPTQTLDYIVVDNGQDNYPETKNGVVAIP